MSDNKTKSPIEVRCRACHFEFVADQATIPVGEHWPKCPLCGKVIGCWTKYDDGSLLRREP
jgi:NAD-dependent SIR2 family protein deacetylase